MKIENEEHDMTDQDNLPDGVAQLIARSNRLGSDPASCAREVGAPR